MNAAISIQLLVYSSEKIENFETIKGLKGNQQ